MAGLRARFRVRLRAPPRCSRGRSARAWHSFTQRMPGGALQRKGNIAARAGRWSARHRKTAIFGWIAFVIVAFMIGGGMGVKQLDSSKQGVGESGRASQTVVKAFPHDDESVSERVLVERRSSTADGPYFKAAVTDVVHRLQGTKYVQNIANPYMSGDPAQVS